MKIEIGSITEAFSVHANAFYVGTILLGGKIHSFKFGGPDGETIYAHAEDGKLLAEFPRQSVSIQYK